MLQLAVAERACAKVTGAIRMAALSGWTIAIFAGITLIAGISDMNGVWMGLLMTIAAFIEFRARERLRRLETSAARTLGCNQIVLGLLIVLYAGWNIWGPNLSLPQSIDFHYLLRDGSIRFLSQNRSSHTQSDLLLYGVLGMLALITQGTAAWYCFSREKWIRQYVSSAPSWIVQCQRAGARFA